MVLADLGADVLRIDRPGPIDLGLPVEPHLELLHRGRSSVVVDLKSDRGRRLALALVRRADGLVEGFRPQVMERLGLGPAECFAINPRLVYGRVTGWGREGPLAGMPGHDIGYIALTGALHAIGPRDGPPTPPLNLLGDFAGGGLYLALGVTAALVARERTGLGQVVDAAMVDGIASLLTFVLAQRAAGAWTDERGSNSLDGGAPWYAVYETADGGYVSVGAIEDRFYEALLRLLGLDPGGLPPRADKAGWPTIRAQIADRLRGRPRDEWARMAEGTDACLVPVLSLTEAPQHAHLRARSTYVVRDGVLQAGPAPRFAGTPAELSGGPAAPGMGGRAALEAWGLTERELEGLET
jgi:alpha-methylacyl-CoA racemase